MATNANPSTRPTVNLQDPQEVQKVFERFDSNGDGKISAEELAGVMKALGSDISPEELGRIMEGIDTDKDGFINLQEFAGFCKGDGDGGMNELREAFDLYDEDRNGLISAAELHKILTRLGEHCTMDACVGMIKSVDSDGDGSVSFEEFKKMMTNKQ
ncbi:PREDICTED: calcium-binding allergen Ole e 8 [Ipomoea nil]|uniref:calcium-binding allergen Ole e 8 n=1 Tax=Ipomoea nil TaxID=35883 RepID=UPI000900C78C|nr:PREDICTED: calcium-binding allergen Ole e 8 [Ipomoea nil]